MLIPAKTEVRFQDAQFIRGLVIGALKHALAQAGHRTSTTIGQAALHMARIPASSSGPSHSFPFIKPAYCLPGPFRQPFSPQLSVKEEGEAIQPFGEPDSSAGVQPYISSPARAPSFYLGQAQAQVHETYIIAASEEGIVIVDQHAAHERLTYERLKKDIPGWRSQKPRPPGARSGFLS